MTDDNVPESTFVPAEPVEPPAPADDTAPPSEPQEAASGAEDDPATFSREYVAKLRQEAAEARVKAKRTDDANARLLAAYVAGTGRIVDPDAVALSDDLIGDDGLVDREKVAAKVDALVAAKPYLASRTPTSPIPQGALPEEPEPVGLFARLRV